MENPDPVLLAEDRARRIAYYSCFPDDTSFAVGLRAMLGARNGDVEILSRTPNVYRSTSPSEIVECRVGRDAPLRLLCKYGLTHRHEGFGHRGGAAYEAEVYRHLLRPTGSGARFYGSYEAEPGQTWIAVEFLDGALSLDRTDLDPALVVETSADWIGRFHVLGSRLIATRAAAFLTAYDREYYAGWAERTLAFSAPLHGKYPWLPALCRTFDSLVDALLSGPLTVIHGEYTVHNVLARGREVYPIDWESTAIGPGEVDLAAILEGWPRGIQQRIAEAYARARWDGTPPAGNSERLVAARLYWEFRWLGERPDWTLATKQAKRYPQLLQIAEEAGLL